MSEPDDDSNPNKALSWRWKLTLLTVVFALLPLVALAYWEISTVEEAFRSQTLSSLEAIATAKANSVEQLTGNRRRDVERMATLLAPRLLSLLEAEAEVEAAHPRERETPDGPLPALQDAEALPDSGERPPREPGAENGGGDPIVPASDPTEDLPVRQREAAAAFRDAEDSLRRAIGLILWDQAEFEELLVIDREGRVRVATFAEHEETDASQLAYFQGGLRTTHVQPVFRSPISQRLTMVITTPIRDASAQVIGVLAARLNLSSLFSIVNDSTGLARTGETVVGRVIEEEMVLMAPTRHDPQAALSRRFALDRPDAMPLVEAARGQGGSGDYVDYREERVLAAWRPIPSLEWGLGVKMDEAEALKPAIDVQMRTIQIAVVLLVMAVFASFFLGREMVRPLRELKDATDRISRGDFDVKINIRSGDEIGELADSFERMVAAIKFFREHARKEEEEEDELEADEIAARQAAREPDES